MTEQCEDEIEETGGGVRCGFGADEVPSVFTISQKALEKVQKSTAAGAGGGVGSGIHAQKEALVASMEETWLKKEKCIEDEHAKRWRYRIEDIEEMESRLMKVFDKLQDCPAEARVVECYKTVPKVLECRPHVVDYITCVENHTQKVISRAGAVSCVKARPKTKLFTD